MKDNIEPARKSVTDGEETSLVIIEDTLLEIKHKYFQMIDEHRIHNKSEASEFNIFNILGVADYEVSTHSAFLRELFDPQGSHGQGNLFFLSFLLMLANKGTVQKNEIVSYTHTEFDDYVVESERTVDTGRIDVIIEREGGNFPFCFIVENKVWAADQEGQLARYWLELSTMTSIPSVRKKILYLTIHGQLPSEWSIDSPLRTELESNKILHYLSYKQDIRQWLETVLPEVKSEKVKFLLIQYIDVIKNLTGEIMNNLNAKTFEFMTQPNNWQFARGLFEIVPIVKEQLIAGFWKEVESILAKSLTVEEFSIVNLISDDKYECETGLCITRSAWRGIFHVGIGALKGRTFNAVWCDSAHTGMSDQIYN